MQVEPPKAVGQHLAREDPYRKLVALAQPVGQRDADIPARQAHLVGHGFSLAVEIGEMVAPSLHLGARGGQRIRCAAGGTGIVIKTGESGGDLRRRSEKFLQLVAVDPQIGKPFIRETPGEPVDAADRFIRAQGTRIEVELFDQPHHHACTYRTLVALDQIEIAGRNLKPRGRRCLRHAFPLAQATDRGSGE